MVLYILTPILLYNGNLKLQHDLGVLIFINQHIIFWNLSLEDKENAVKISR